MEAGNVCKVFEFQNGWQCALTVCEGKMTFEVEKGEKRLKASCYDKIALRSGGSALLLGGKVSAEESEDNLMLHACPVEAENGTPIAAKMVHYHLEKAGENALRVSTWFSEGFSMPQKGTKWLNLQVEKDEVRECVGVKPGWRVKADEVSHAVCFAAAALTTKDAYLMLSDCGGVRYVPNAGENRRALQAAAFDQGEELLMRDAAHPFSAVISFGEGEPALPNVQKLNAPKARAAQGELVTLESGRLTMGVRVRADGLSMLPVSLEDASRRTEWAAFPLARVLVQELASGKVCALTTEQGWEKVSVKHTAHRLSLYLEKPQGIDLCLSVEGRAVEGDAIEWRTRVLNQSEEWTVLSVSYPGVSFEGGEQLRLFTPSASGRVFEEVYEREVGYTGNYPSGFEGVVPVMGVYEAEGKKGLYAAIHDHSATGKEIRCETFRSGSGYFCFDYPAENMGRPRNSFEAGGCLVVKAFTGDWYDMAKIYKAFAKSCPWYPPLGREDSPEWMRDVPMYVMDWMPNDNPDADPVPISIRPPVEPARDNWYKKPIELAEYLGLPIGYHLYNWHWIPFNNDYPYYFPVKEGLKEGVLELKKHGVHVMPYINGRIADTRDSRGEVVRFDRELRPGAIKQLDGSLYIETYASHEPDGSLCRLAAMCPTSPVWRDLMAETVSRLFHEYHMDAVYIDQVSAAGVTLCCDPSHDHTPGNGDWWVKGYRLLMERLRRECPEGCGFTSECNAEAYADQFDGFLTWGWVNATMVPFFPKLYAGRVAMAGRNTNGYKKEDAQFFRFHAGQAVLFGQQIGWINADVVDDERKRDYLKRMCWLRWEHNEFFTQGEMLRPPVIEEGQRLYLCDTSMGRDELHPVGLIQAGGWRHGKRVMLALTNTSDEETEVALSYDAEEYGAGKLVEQKNYGDCECMRCENGELHAKMGARSALVMIWEGEK